MANIYTEQQVGNYAHDIDSTGLFEEARRVENYGKQFEQQAQNYEDKAKNTYALALKVQWQTSINDIAANPEFASNPVAMEKEIKNITDKMSAEIVDDDAKTDFLINSITKRNAYVQKAYAQRIKIQEEQYKSSVYNSIYSNIDSIGLSMADGILGVGDGSTLDASLLSDKEIREGINAKDEYGNYIFSDTERRSMIKDYEKNVFDNVKAGFELLTESQRKLFSEQLDKDSVSLGVVKDKDGNEVNIPLASVVSKATYADIKKFVRDEKDKRKANEIKEFNLEKKYAYMSFLKDPTEENLQNYIALHPETSESSLDRLSEMVKNKPNYSAETTFSGMKEAESVLTRIAEKPIQSEAQIANKLDELRDFIYALNKSNQEGRISVEDKEEMAEAAYRMFNDSVFMEQVHTIFGKPGAFKSFVNWSLGDGSFDRIESIGLFATREAINRLLQNDPEGAKTVYAEGQKLAIQERYPEIPFNNLKEGDVFWYGPTEQAFKFLGYGIDDVLVEVNPTTGAVVK